MQSLFDTEFKETLDTLKAHIEEITSLGDQVDMHRSFLDNLIREVSLIRNQMEQGLQQYERLTQESSAELKGGFDTALTDFEKKLDSHTRQAEENQVSMQSLQDAWWKEKNEDLIELADQWKSDLSQQLESISAKLDVWKKDHIQTFMTNLQTNIERYASVFKKQSDTLSAQFSEHGENAISSLNSTISAIQELGTFAESSSEKLSTQIDQTRAAIDWWVVHSKELADRHASMHKDLEDKHEGVLVREVEKVKTELQTVFLNLQESFEQQCNLLVTTSKENLDKQKSIQDALMERVEKLSQATEPLIETLDTLVKKLQAFKLQEAFDALHVRLDTLESGQKELRDHLSKLDKQLASSVEQNQVNVQESISELEKQQKLQQTLQYVIIALLVVGFIFVAYYININAF